MKFAVGLIYSRVSQNGGNFLNNYGTISFSRRIMLYGDSFLHILFTNT